MKSTVLCNPPERRSSTGRSRILWKVTEAGIQPLDELATRGIALGSGKQGGALQWLHQSDGWMAPPGRKVFRPLKAVTTVHSP
eukprot:1111336-Prymnesium_polylepis.1